MYKIYMASVFHISKDIAAYIAAESFLLTGTDDCLSLIHIWTAIDRQFEYNTYIRDFYAENTGKSLEDAIKCWKYKKSLPGHNRYEKSDLNIL